MRGSLPSTSGGGGGGGSSGTKSPVLGFLEGRGLLGVVTVFTVAVSLHLSTFGTADGGGVASGVAGGSQSRASSAHHRGSSNTRRHDHGGNVAYELLELELAARMRGERPSPDLGMEGLNVAKVKRLKATACYKGAECDSGLCVEGRCVCPLLYSGPGCANLTEVGLLNPGKVSDWLHGYHRLNGVLF
jgi:hypothetical protein